MDPTTSLPSKPCYLPIFEAGLGTKTLRSYTDIWRNFMSARDMTIEGWQAEIRIKDYNGTLINDGVVFDTEQDKMWFVLRWS